MEIDILYISSIILASAIGYCLGLWAAVYMVKRAFEEENNEIDIFAHTVVNQHRQTGSSVSGVVQI